MKRIALLLLAGALNANAATLIINGAPTEGTVVITTGAAPPAPTPTPPPTPTPTPTPTPPPTSTCGPGQVMGGGDIVWSDFKDTQLWPVPPVTGFGDAGRAVQFVADAARYPRGVMLKGIDEHQPTQPKDYVISECPHSFTPVGPNCTRNSAGAYATLAALRFGPASQSYDCSLNPGQAYYINFRDYLTPRGNVYSQFAIQSRVD